jgi:hypothetical protein
MSGFHVRRDKAALFPAGASPARRPLQPEAAGAGMEETKCLKPSDIGFESGPLLSMIDDGNF